jgi:hypothetical protein
MVDFTSILGGACVVLGILTTYLYGKVKGLSPALASALEQLQKGATTGTAAEATSVPSVAADATAATEKTDSTAAAPAADFKATPEFPAGKAIITGIYTDSASAHVPAAVVTVDVNQVPELFAEFQALVTGKVIYSIQIDGNDLKDCQEEGINLTKVGDKVPIAFWIPQKYRTVATHIITIRQGHLEGAENTTTGGSDSVVVYDTTETFALIMTGTKTPIS